MRLGPAAAAATGRRRHPQGQPRRDLLGRRQREPHPGGGAGRRARRARARDAAAVRHAAPVPEIAGVAHKRYIITCTIALV